MTSPGAGQVLLTVLASAGGRDEQGHTQQAVLDEVLGVVSGDTVRPLTDHVEVRSAEPVSYDIALKYYVTPATESQVILAVEGEGGAIEQYNAWQSAELGRSINPDMLRAYLIQAGRAVGRGHAAGADLDTAASVRLRRHDRRDA